ncbi:uncharacterized protein LOC111707372 [Eurytemora carolleeae]|uniref:uncharacterized protein LOC111707372 n=1 Tax=Eurytemora carolleeae TaxID=1294199 RepID=UPI000C7831AA|nr:uncharacterized protein LOC111707372 [Eurytemora carolleeae]|eukprot:XP_023336244.1 uncharacterized protein LOC111707372 [Eurytemora affinis]
MMHFSYKNQRTVQSTILIMQVLLEVCTVQGVEKLYCDSCLDCTDETTSKRVLCLEEESAYCLTQVSRKLGEEGNDTQRYGFPEVNNYIQNTFFSSENASFILNKLCISETTGKSMIKDGLKTDDLNPVVVVGDGSEDLLCSEETALNLGELWKGTLMQNYKMAKDPKFSPTFVCLCKKSGCNAGNLLSSEHVPLLILFLQIVFLFC